MRIKTFKNEEEWLEARRGIFTGTKVGATVSLSYTKDDIISELESHGIEYPKNAKKEELESLLPLKSIVKLKLGGPKKKGFWQLIAERVAIPATDENVMDRGHRLEKVALERFEKEIGKKVNKDLIIAYRDDSDSIAYSPDGMIGATADAEVKCLNSASHIEAWFTKKIPDEYSEQVIQGFVVNDKLRTRYVIFFDPRMPRDFFWIEVKRKDLKREIAEYLEIERQLLVEIEKLEKEITF